MMSNVSTYGMIGLLYFGAISTPLVAVSRQWIVGFRVRSTHTAAADFCIWLCVVVGEIQYGLLLADIHKHKGFREQSSGGKGGILVSTLDRQYLVVSTALESPFTSLSLEQEFFAETLFYTTVLPLLKTAYLTYFPWRHFGVIQRYLFFIYAWVAAGWATSLTLQLVWCRPISLNWYFIKTA